MGRIVGKATAWDKFLLRVKTAFAVLAVYCLSTLSSSAQKVNPQAYYTDEDGNDVETTNVDNGQAPLDVTFRANPEDMDGHSPSYEWHFIKVTEGSTREELFVRYEEDTQYTFTEAGTFHVVLKTFLDDETSAHDSIPLVVVVPASKLEFPNAFSPNGDGRNDIYKAKDGGKSIVSFHATIINRWGQKLYEWDTLEGGWNGTFRGSPVRDGTYYVIVNARGADGIEYKIRKDVNLLRGLRESSGGTAGTGGGE